MAIEIIEYEAVEPSIKSSPFSFAVRKQIYDALEEARKKDNLSGCVKVDLEDIPSNNKLGWLNNIVRRLKLNVKPKWLEGVGIKITAIKTIENDTNVLKGYCLSFKGYFEKDTYTKAQKEAD